MSRKKKLDEPFDAKQEMITALLALMCEKKYDDIRIIEICDRAKIARCTFYRYFSDKNALLMYCCKKEFKGLSTRLEQENCRTFYGMSIGFYGYWLAHKKFLDTLNNAGMLGYLSWHFDELMFDVAKEVKPENADMGYKDFSPKVRLHYFFGMGGFWNSTVRWIQNDYKETPEELAQYVVAYFVESFENEPDCQYYLKNGRYPYETCYIKPENEF